MFENGGFMSKRVFIAFAVEDKTFRHFLVGHARHPKTPFEFVDMSVKVKKYRQSRRGALGDTVRLRGRNTDYADVDQRRTPRTSDFAEG
jgi:hypothetical protein